MKSEEAIKCLELRKSWVAEINIDALQSYKMAIDALEKQIPKEPKIYQNLNETACPECVWVFGYAGDEYDGEKYPYCPNCGQALKWGE